MTGTALVTGASNGIGLELAKEHAKRGGDLVLVARSKDALQALSEELHVLYGVSSLVIPMDLSKPGSPAKLQKELEKQDVRVDVLVNNAGFGGYGRFWERKTADDLQMIDLNVRALTELTHRFTPAMVARGHGRILNVGSVAGFLPGPLQATYYATKAFVVSWTQAIAEELRGTGVTATVLCPGPVQTGFKQEAGIEAGRLFHGAPGPAPVAAYGYKAMEKGKVVAVHGALMKATVASLRAAPRKAAAKAARKTVE